MDSKLFNKLNFDRVNLIILIIGIISLIVGVIVKVQNFKTVFMSVGCSLISTSIASYISSRYLIERNKIKEIIDKWGLIGIYRTRSEMNINTNIHMNDLREELDIVAMGLRGLRVVQGNIIEKKVKDGVKIKILTINPESVFVSVREKDEGAVKDEIKNTILELIKWVTKLREIAPITSNVELKLYDSLPLDSFLREDDYIYIGPYLFDFPSQQTISYEFKANSLGYDYYKNYFEKLWNDKNLTQPYFK